MLKSIRTKNKCFKQICKIRDCGDEHSSEETVPHKKYRNLLIQATSEAKQLYYNDQIVAARNNSERIWKTMRDLCNIKKRKPFL